MTFYIVLFRKATGLDEITYLAQLPEKLPSGRFNEYGIVSNVQQAKRFTSEQKARWHAARRQRWFPSVIKETTRTTENDGK